MMHKYLTIFLTTIVLGASGQTAKTPPEEKPTGDPIFNIQFHYTYVQPEGDLRSQFGNFHNIGMGGLYKMQSNWMLGFDASYQFGTKVKDLSFLDDLANTSGVVMTAGGTPATYSVGMRGLSVFAKGGYLFPVSWKNRNMGVMVLLGAGMYYHKYSISTTGSVPTLTDDLKKGYDKLAKGPAVSQFLGFYYNSPNRYYNFYIGVDFMQAFTKNVREYDYSTRTYDRGQHTDMNIGARIGWMIPIYMMAKNSANEYQFK
jgi:hypothetical protein